MKVKVYYERGCGGGGYKTITIPKTSNLNPLTDGDQTDVINYFKDRITSYLHLPPRRPDKIDTVNIVEWEVINHV